MYYPAHHIAPTLLHQIITFSYLSKIFYGAGASLKTLRSRQLWGRYSASEMGSDFFKSGIHKLLFCFKNVDKTRGNHFVQLDFLLD